jgi:D-arginine dehydrogenase
MTGTAFDIIVIGAGIAGASVAAELAGAHRVLLLEREAQPGYHTTGRSAALFTIAYGPPVIRALTRASHAALKSPPDGAPSYLSPRGVVFAARGDQHAALAALHADLGDAVRPMTAAEVARAVPLLRPGYATAGLHDASAADIDVARLHQQYLARLRAAGGVLHCKAEVTAMSRTTDWQVTTSRGVFSAPVVVNAAGAWADGIARIAGLRSAGLTPKRRTALIVAPPDGVDTDALPLVVDAEESFYLKPEAGQLLISPADATPSPPCDAQPDEMDVALCVDRIERAFDLQVRRIGHKWAGLRSFLPDGDPLAGFDPHAEGFFWLAGQGGYGIQTAPALARAAAALVQGLPLPADITAQGVTDTALARTRPGLP